MRCKGILKISINQIVLKKKIIISRKVSNLNRFTMILFSEISSDRYFLYPINKFCTLSSECKNSIHFT